MAKRIQIKILPDGKVEAKTLGIKGKACLAYVKRFTGLIDAQVTDSNLTAEYYEVNQHLIGDQSQSMTDQTLGQNIDK